MVCAEEVYQWFKELPAHNRVDFIYNIMQICLPNELRFFGTLLEDMNSKDYANLREIEERSNSPNEFRQYPHTRLTAEIIHKLCLSLSLLKSTNQKVAQVIYEILRIHFDFAKTCMSFKNDISEEILLLYSMASYHPAFNFSEKQKLSEKLKILLTEFKDPTSKNSLNSNNNSCYNKHQDANRVISLNRMCIAILDVTIDKNDAIITLSLKDTLNCEAERRTATYSQFNEFLLKFTETRTDFMKTYKYFDNLSNNGNFNPINIKHVILNILDKLHDNEPQIVNEIVDYFQQLPIIDDIHNSGADSAETQPSCELQSHLYAAVQTDCPPVRPGVSDSPLECRKSVVVSVNSPLSAEVTTESASHLGKTVYHEDGIDDALATDLVTTKSTSNFLHKEATDLSTTAAVSQPSETPQQYPMQPQAASSSPQYFYLPTSLVPFSVYPFPSPYYYTAPPPKVETQPPSATASANKVIMMMHHHHHNTPPAKPVIFNFSHQHAALYSTGGGGLSSNVFYSDYIPSSAPQTTSSSSNYDVSYPPLPSTRKYSPPSPTSSSSSSYRSNQPPPRMQIPASRQ